MAGSRSHLAGCSGHLYHSAAELLLLHSAGGELEGSEEEDGTLSNIVAREERLHASDKVRAGQRKLLKVGRGKKEKMELTFLLFTAMMESRMKRHLI